MFFFSSSIPLGFDDFSVFFVFSFFCMLWFFHSPSSLTKPASGRPESALG